VVPRMLTGLIVDLVLGVGKTKGDRSGKRSRSEEIFRVGNGVMVIPGDGVAIGVIVACGVGTVGVGVQGIGTMVGVIDGNLVGILRKEDDPVRWCDIRSPALIARADVHTIASMNIESIKERYFIGIPRGELR
jgi:hypothetical protein